MEAHKSMEQKSLLQRVRDAAAQRNMEFTEYLHYADKPNNDLSPDEQWEVMNVKAALRRETKRILK